MAKKSSKRKRASSSAEAAARERQREITRDESLQRDQNLSFDADRKAKARQAEDAMANAQRGMNAEEAARLKEGDYVKVNLEDVPENIKSLNINRYRQLHTLGAHGVAGRIIGVEVLPEGRHFKVDSPTHTLTVPEAAVVRIDKADLTPHKARARGKSKSARKRSRAAKSGTKKAASA